MTLSMFFVCVCVVYRYIKRIKLFVAFRKMHILYIHYIYILHICTIGSNTVHDILKDDSNFRILYEEKSGAPTFTFDADHPGGRAIG